jgi:hypothetical protein
MMLCKLLTFWIYPKKNKRLVRDFLYWFNYSDYLRFKNLNYNVVSLGNACLTRALLVSIGLKPRRFYGEKSCPFDLYRSKDLAKTIDLIEHDFADFLKDIDTEAFPHDEQLSLLEFNKRYKRRIKNYLEIQKSDKKLYYVYSNYSTLNAEDVKKLYEVLKSKRNGKPFELIVLSSKNIDVPNIIQIPYEIKFKDGRTIEYIIDRYRDFDNEVIKFKNYVGQRLKKVIT